MSAAPNISQGQTPTTTTHASLNTLAIHDHDWFMVHDWIDALPLPSRFFQTIAFFALGVAATAGFAWNEATTDADFRYYRVATIAALLVGLAFLLCDHKLRKEQGKSAAFISDHMAQINNTLGVTRPVRPSQPSVWTRAGTWLRRFWA